MAAARRLTNDQIEFAVYMRSMIEDVSRNINNTQAANANDFYFLDDELECDSEIDSSISETIQGTVDCEMYFD